MDQSRVIQARERIEKWATQHVEPEGKPAEDTQEEVVVDEVMEDDPAQQE